MPNYTKKIVQHSLIFGSGEILSRLVGFILIPLYTHYLPQDRYGALQIFLITSNLIGILLQMGIGSAIFKSVIYDKNRDNRIKYSTALNFLLLSGLAAITVFQLLSSRLSILLFQSAEYQTEIRIILATVFFRNISVIPLSKLRIEGKTPTYSLLSFFRFMVQLGLNILFVAKLGYGIRGILTAELIAYAAFIPLYFGILRKQYEFRMHLAELKEVLHFGVPLIPAAVSMFLLNMSSQYFLQHYSGLENVAIYALAYRFAMIISLMVAAFQFTWASQMFEIAREENARDIFSKNFTRFYGAITLVCILLNLLVRPLIRTMATPEYLEAARIVPILNLSYLFFGVFYYSSIGINLKKKTVYQSLYAVIGAIVNLGLNLWMVPRHGVMGAAAANAISFFVMAALTLIKSERLYPIGYQKKRILLISAVYIAQLVFLYH
ncbi:polysaccharide biosynthesis C-terminal domain-containing protein [bacterium]|nr:polysaccharide biosynthesis C-terminal domain-containing protein [bacterium]